jgi:hypothetical protein
MKILKKFDTFINENKLTENSENNLKKFGKYLTLEKFENFLKIYLTDEGKEKASEDGLSCDNFWDFFEDIQVNSEFTYIDNLGEVGFGLTEAPGFLYGYSLNDNGKYEEDFSGAEVYYDNDYMIKDFCETLIEKGFKIFRKV